MKKTILSIFSVAAIATATNAQVTYGPEVGLNISNYMGKSGGKTQSTTAKAGLRVGGVVDFGLTDNISLQPGIFYVMNGYKQSAFGTDVSVSVNTIEVPINVEYKFGMPGGNRFFVGVGPYIALNMGGNVKISGMPDRSLQIGSDANKDDMKALDFGAGINFGYQLVKGFYARAHYQMGFSNLDPAGNADNTMHNSNFGVAVGYMFGGKMMKKAPAKKK